jgi:hypothetical protein
MPIPDVAVQAHNLVEIGFAILGFGGVAASGYVGFARLSAKFDGFKDANDRAHKRMEAAQKEQNGQLDQHGQAISAIVATCAERVRLGEILREQSNARMSRQEDSKE